MLNSESGIPAMSLLPPLPIPSAEWLLKRNEIYGRRDLPPGERPIRALEDWAAEHRQPLDLISQLGGDAWREVDGFFAKHTKLGIERSQPLGRSAWFYRGSFFQIGLPVIIGGWGPSTEINVFKGLLASMPMPLLQEFSHRKPEVRAYEEHLANAMDSLSGSGAIIGTLKSPFAQEMLTAAETVLDSAVANLLDTPPNNQAAAHSRSAFEAALKGFLAETTGLTEPEAKKIGHRLDKLINVTIPCCGNLISSPDLARLKVAAMDSISSPATRRFFPDHGASYRVTILPAQRRLWDCYAAAQHAFATVLRVFGASDCRRHAS
jgi:hypothetical protein